MASVEIGTEIMQELNKLQAIKQIATGKKIRATQEVIADLLTLKRNLPYFLIASKKLSGILSHNRTSEEKRKKTLKKLKNGRKKRHS